MRHGTGVTITDLSLCAGTGVTRHGPLMNSILLIQPLTFRRSRKQLHPSTRQCLPILISLPAISSSLMTKMYQYSSGLCMRLLADGSGGGQKDLNHARHCGDLCLTAWLIITA